MDDELEKLQKAKMFMEYLSKGIDPIRLDDVDVDTFRDEELRACFKYLAEVLEKDIERTPKVRRGRKAVYITDEQRASLTTAGIRKVSEIAQEINRVIADNQTRRFRATWITDWLEEKGYLTQNEIGDRVATEAGKRLGITSRHKKWSGDDGAQEYYVNLYPEAAQEFIFQHLDEILDKRYDGKKAIAVGFQQVDIPYDISIREFVGHYPEKCFLIVSGSFDYARKHGAFRAALLYKGRRKLIEDRNVHTTSSNRCICMGVLAAANAIKAATDIIIITPTSLGFSSPKSKNYDLCRQIIETLDGKECSITVAACSGRGAELSGLLDSLAK